MPAFASFFTTANLNKGLTTAFNGIEGIVNLAAAGASVAGVAPQQRSQQQPRQQARRNSNSSNSSRSNHSHRSNRSNRSTLSAAERRAANAALAANFPAELDEYLERCVYLHNFNFEAISEELITSATGFLRHPYADEPDEMLRDRAAEIFSPAVLRARWEACNPEWEVLEEPADWEVIDGVSISSHQAPGDEEYIVCCRSEADSISTEDDFVDCETASSERSTPTAASSPLATPKLEIPRHVLARMQVPKLVLPEPESEEWCMSQELRAELAAMPSSDEEDSDGDDEADDSDSEGEYLQQCRLKARSPQGQMPPVRVNSKGSAWSTNGHNFRAPARV